MLIEKHNGNWYNKIELILDIILKEAIGSLFFVQNV
jgi:hypothetical protein